MTDISNWSSLIHKKGIKRTVEEIETFKRYFPGHDHEYGPPYIMLPFNEYQLANLLWLLTESQDKNTGDWYGEIRNIIEEVMAIYPDSVKLMEQPNRESNEEYKRIIAFHKRRPYDKNVINID